MLRVARVFAASGKEPSDGFQAWLESFRKFFKILESRRKQKVGSNLVQEKFFLSPFLSRFASQIIKNDSSSGALGKHVGSLREVRTDTSDRRG